MNRDEHIQELICYLSGMSICMCPESRLYWAAHAKEVEDALKEARA